MTGSERSLPKLAGRSALGGLLMGLANLVPGISGGTMLLAAGVYPEFINSIAELTRLVFKPRSLVVLGVVGMTAVLSILFGAGLVKDLVLQHRWLMYSLFIGLTLGGLPVVWALVDKVDAKVIGGAVAGFVGMTGLAVAQASGVAGAGGSDAGVLMLFVGGAVAASAMILPGVSGGYLLLVLDLYVPILSGVDALKHALKSGDIAAAVEPILWVVAPVGIGVVVGIVVVSNVIKWLLEHHQRATLGVLMGLLVGAVVGLYPFQEGRMPAIGEFVKGRVVTAERLADLEEDDWPTVRFTPGPAQLGGAFALVVLGIGITGVVAYIGKDKEAPDA